jgi:predicted DCC family thiol-disulfide oxidoreductase YuxK
VAAGKVRGTEPVFLYDGDCGFCTWSAGLVDRYIHSPVPVVAWQWADLTALGLTVAECQEAVQWVSTTTRSGPAAIAALLRTSTRRGWRLAGRALATRPAIALAWPVYRLIARNRHRLPGGTAACALPRPEVRIATANLRDGSRDGSRAT